MTRARDHLDFDIDGDKCRILVSCLSNIDGALKLTFFWISSSSTKPCQEALESDKLQSQLGVIHWSPSDEEDCRSVSSYIWDFYVGYRVSFKS